MKNSISLLFLSFILSFNVFAQGVSVTRVSGPIVLNEVPAANHYFITISGNTYTPHLLFAIVGDTITISASNTHPLVQIDSSVWLSNGTTPSASGWGTQYSNYTFVISSTDDVFYTCAYHWGMKGKIVVSAQSANRGLFSDVLVIGNSVWTPYQISPHTTALNDDKSLWYKKWDRDLNLVQSQSIAIDVNLDTLYDGDLGDHMWTVLDNKFYMLTTIKGKNGAGLILYDTLFNRKSEPSYAATDTAIDKCLDMGFETDGEFLYAQYYHVPIGCNSPNCWGASIYKYDSTLFSNVLDSSVVFPDSGSFVTGTSLCYVPNGQMGATQDKLQIFSTNNDYGNSQTIGIHTFAADMSLDSIGGSTRTIIQENYDSYWPAGVSWNEQHQLWVVGYTMEYDADSIFPTEEVGRSFLKVFDLNWNLVDSFALNNNNSDSTFRVMTETKDDDIYVVYDEMNVSGTSSTSNCKIEHFKINPSASILASCQNIDVFLDINGSASIQAIDLDGGSTSSSGISSYLASRTTFMCSDIPSGSLSTQIPVTMQIVDSLGLIDSCQSTVTLHDTIYRNFPDIQVACNSYTWTDGNTYTSSNNTANQTFINTYGCDSIITLNLTINTVDVNVAQANVQLTASASGASYQWLDCNNAFSAIAGQTNQSFTAISNGSYAVEIIQNGCTDTSICYTVSTIGINESENKIVIYPNPSSDIINIQSALALKGVKVKLLDINGKIVYESNINNKSNFSIDISDKAKEIYFVKILDKQDRVIMIERILLQ